MYLCSFLVLLLQQLSSQVIPPGNLQLSCTDFDIRFSVKISMMFVAMIEEISCDEAQQVLLIILDFSFPSL